jgi:hypothetical protein
MPNGDLLPFVNNHSGNYKYIYNNQKPVFIYEFGMREEDTLEIQTFTYSGDSVRYIEKWDKIHRTSEREWLTYKNNQLALQKQQSDLQKDTLFCNYYFWEGDYLKKIMRYKDNHFYESVHHKWISANTDLRNVFDKDSNLINNDTIMEVYNADRSIRKISRNSEKKQYYSSQEFMFDIYGNKTGMLALYNKDTIGDHAEFTSYQYTYKKSTAKPFHQKMLIGYWVGFDSYRYFYLYNNGTLLMGKLGRDDKEHAVWQYDSITKILRITIPTKENGKNKTLELHLNTEKMVLKGEDWEFEKRDVFLRPKLPSLVVVK